MKHVGISVVDADLHAFVDNTLPPERRHAILQALEADASEARRVSDWCAQNEAVRRLFSKVVYEQVPVALSLTAAPKRSTGLVNAGEVRKSREPFKFEEPCKPGGPSKPRKPSKLREPAKPGEPDPPIRSGALSTRIEPWRPKRGAMVLFGCAIILAAGWIGGRLYAPHGGGAYVADAGIVGDTLATFAFRSIETYRTFAPDVQYPVEIPSAQSPRLVQWLERRLDEKITIPKLSSVGFNLLGGRLVPWVAHHPAALLLYQNAAGTRLALMLAKAKPGVDRPFRHDSIQGVGAITWTQSGNVVSVVGFAEPMLRSVATVAVAELSEAGNP